MPESRFEGLRLDARRACLLWCLHWDRVSPSLSYILYLDSSVRVRRRFLNSLIFNNEVDAYHAWTLFLIFCSMLILIAGVVLLTFKKPDPTGTGRLGGIALDSPAPARAGRPGKKGMKTDADDDAEGEGAGRAGEGDAEVVWQLGDASDEEEEGVRSRAKSPRPKNPLGGIGAAKGVGGLKEGEGERRRMLDDEDEEQAASHADDGGFLR